MFTLFFVAASAIALILYLRREQPKAAIAIEPQMTRKNAPYPSLTGDSLGEYIATKKIPYVLDIRSDDETRKSGLKHIDPLIVVYIPFNQGREARFLEDVHADSRMQTILEEKREFLVMCASGARSEHACILLAKRGFHPINLYDGLAQVPSQYMRTTRS